MDINNKPNRSQSDDEDDLEALRLAALQTLKKKSSEYDDSTLSNSPHGNKPGYNNTSKGSRKRGRYFPSQMRNSKGGQYTKGQYNNRSSGQFNSRVRSANLISITPVQTSEDAIPSKQILGRSTDVPKLILPQDRYNKPVTEPEKSEGPMSKFDRYNNSESESEDEDDAEEIEDSTQSNLKRSDSLEELMKELEDEIQGDSKPKEQPKESKPKSKVKRKKGANIDAPPEGLSVSNKHKETIVTEKKPVQDHNESAPKKETEPVKLKEYKGITKREEKEVNVRDHNNCVIKSPTKNSADAENKACSPLKSTHRVRSPSHRKTDYHRKSNMNYTKSQQSLPFSQTTLSQNPVFTPQTPVFIPFANPVPVINPAFNITNFIPTVPPPTAITQPPFIQNHTPLSPLSINTDNINTAITAPLSPRSAAFVMENRAIIEKRKRSPRRSYSRTPSPRSRHSSPRRSFTPKRGSLSPRISPRSHRRSLTPKKTSMSPRRYSPRRRSRTPRRSLSPVRRESPLQRRYSPKRTRPHIPPAGRGSVYDRLGVKVSSGKTESSTPDNKERERVTRKSRSRSGTPLRDEKPENTEKTDKLEVFDPVLEARRRKFESNGIKSKDGIIRLKPREEDRARAPEKKTEENQVESREVSTSSKCEPSSNKGDKPSKTSTKKENRRGKDDIDFSGAGIEESLMSESKDEEEKIDDLSDLNEDELLAFDEILDLSPPVGRLLSDDESDDENEGRFKVKVQPETKIPVLPFKKLVAGMRSEFKENLVVTKSVSNIKKELPKSREDKRKRSDSPASERKSINQKSDAAPSLSSKVVAADIKHEAKKPRFSGRLQVSNKTSHKIDKPPITTPIENKRIEIKIKHPSKYKKAENEEKEVDKKDDDKCMYITRKVEITKRDENDSESETEILVENEDNTLTLETRHNDGDLRAQLSRKRAERQKRPESERSSRLLHDALDQAIFKKSKKSKKEKEAKKEHQALRRLLKLEKLKRNMNRAIKLNDKLHVYEHIELCYDPDVRLPIHMRLGMANAAELHPVVKKKKSSKKHRKRAVEQDYVHEILAKKKL